MESDGESEDVPRLITSFFDEPESRSRPVVSHKVASPEPVAVRSFKDALLQAYKSAQAAHAALMEQQGEEPVKAPAAPEIAKADATALFGDNLTEQEQEMLKQRLAAQQKNMQDLERKRLGRKNRMLRSMYSFLTQREAELALKACGGDEDEAAEKLTVYDFLHEIRKQVAMEFGRALHKVASRQMAHAVQGCVTARNLKVGEVLQKKKVFIGRRVRLDDALKRAQAGDLEGWSDARIRAYKLIDTNPNAYYYRFNDPGVKQRNGKWTKEEQDMFMRRMAEVGVDGNWGVFSMAIPGRVGYQCSNFYRFLIQQGKVTDPNYVIDEKGKVHYLFSKGVRKTAKRVASGDVATDSPASPPKKKTTRKKKNSDDECAGESDDGNYHGSFKSTEAEVMAKRRARNPLPGFIDPITAEEVEDPSISPYGHVMGKTTWSRCLQQEPKNTCPFTKLPLRKRDLVDLTHENIEQYRDKIKTVVS